MNNHNKRTQKLCIFCLECPKSMIKFKFHVSIYQLLPNYEASFYPSVVCRTCLSKFNAFTAKNDQAAKSKLADKIVSKGHASQKGSRRYSSNDDCSCFFCKIVQKRFKVAGFSKHAAPKYKHEHSSKRLCGDCLNDVQKLNKSKCSKRMAIKSLETYCEQQGLTEAFVHKMLRKLSKNGKANKIVKLKTFRGTEVSVLYNYKPKTFTTSDVNMLKNSILRSGNKLKQNLRLIRKALGRGAVKTNVEQILMREEAIFEDLLNYKV